MTQRDGLQVQLQAAEQDLSDQTAQRQELIVALQTAADQTQRLREELTLANAQVSQIRLDNATLEETRQRLTPMPHRDVPPAACAQRNRMRCDPPWRNRRRSISKSLAQWNAYSVAGTEQTNVRSPGHGLDETTKVVAG